MPLVQQPPAAAAAGGGGTVLFDSTLVSAAAGIDTGAAGIAGGHALIVVYMMLQTVDAGATAAVDVRFNNDSGANYDSAFSGSNGGAASNGTSLAQTSFNLGVHGAGGTAGYPTFYVLTIPNYAGTTFFKALAGQSGRIDATAGNTQAFFNAFGYRSTSAISRAAVTGSTANLAAGSRMTVVAFG